MWAKFNNTLLETAEQNIMKEGLKCRKSWIISDILQMIEKRYTVKNKNVTR